MEMSAGVSNPQPLKRAVSPEYGQPYKAQLLHIRVLLRHCSYLATLTSAYS